MFHDDNHNGWPQVSRVIKTGIFCTMFCAIIYTIYFEKT